MENVEIARVLSKYAELLEIQGADLFRIQPIEMRREPSKLSRLRSPS